MNYSTIQKIQHIILLSRKDKDKDHYQHHCLNLLWYNLLMQTEYNDSWKNNMSESCINEINKYFKNKNITL